MLNKDDLIIEIEKDQVKSIRGKRAGDFGDMVSGLGSELMNIGEIAFGTNPLCVMRGDPTVIEEEKKLGTAHFGHGLNLEVAAKSSVSTPHSDGVFNGPNIIVDGVKVFG